MSDSESELKKQERLRALKEKREKLEAMRNRKKNREQQNDNSIIEGITNALDVDDLLKLTIKKDEDNSEISNNENSITDQREKKSEKEQPTIQSRPQITLSLKKSVHFFSVVPKKIELYNKSSQIGDSTFIIENKENEQEHKPHVITQSHVIESNEEVPEEKVEEEEKYPEISETDKQIIKSSENFSQFIDRASITMERAIYSSNQYDILVDYSIDTFDSQNKRAHEKKLTFETKMFDERWSKNRSITDISWSPIHNELFAVSYSSSETNSNDPDGVVLLWSVLNTLGRPEKVCTCQSSVTSTLLPQYYPTVILGGTYSGQLVLWDTRAKSFPVQKTPLSSSGHSHPIYGMSLVGTQHANSLITVSTDGKMCAWDLANLEKPKEVLELNVSSSTSKTSTPVASTVLEFPDGEVDNFFTGSESGSIFRAYRHGSESGVKDKYSGHYGLVTGLSFHSKRGLIDFGELFLSSSIDWTVKLWSQKNTETPLISFEEHSDYVYDVAWSPVHPSVFASADGSGKVALWDLNEETEVSIQISKPHLETDEKNNKVIPVNKLCWSNDGKKFVAGDSVGDLFVYSSSEALYSPEDKEWDKFQDVLNVLREGSIDTNF
eukprot:TRINITY_DN4422_c0_g1_i1.p1 TRINITY_DN4422_c0_g1~~TRINITY_DN4422_c0_g1_i1.p1  ORF type:complete len:608 (-),score=172.96 TRINITY_DN4422_c0_g1_i1:149-1972(-)